MPTTPLKKYLKIHIHNLIILFILIAVTFGNSLSNAFLSDDLAEIVNNPNIGNLSYAITSHPFGFIRLMFYWLAFQLGDLNPILFRLINIFFHTGSVLLIYVLFSTIFSKRLALFASAIFAIHPAISEAVVWISGGGYPQYTFFFLLSLLLYIFSSKRLFFYFLSSIFYILSFMSHPQMPLALILIFPFWEFAFGNLKRNWVKSVPFFLIAIVFVFNTLNSLPERETTLSSVHYQERGIDNPLILIPIAISSYFELIMFPKTLTLYHSELAFGPVQFAVRSLITLLFLTSLLITFKKNKFL
ncbi:hypothetical protein HY384_01580, partial [Candidatus Daviesbacteria bacterium]|nr:hypothetical protein [Candidatus Daviesbacteria bacterium]